VLWRLGAPPAAGEGAVAFPGVTGMGGQPSSGNDVVENVIGHFVGFLKNSSPAS
jgi:hypothetical protein